MLGNNPSSTPYNLAVPLFSKNMKVKKPDYKAGELSQQYPLESGSTPYQHKNGAIKT